MKCPVKTNGADCHFSHGMYSHLATHIKKQHTKGDYTKFRLTPTVEAPFVCKGCDWAFTEGQIKNHFHEAKAVCTRNRKSKTEVESKEEQPLLVFDKPPVKPLISANQGPVIASPILPTVEENRSETIAKENIADSSAKNFENSDQVLPELEKIQSDPSVAPSNEVPVELQISKDKNLESDGKDYQKQSNSPQSSIMNEVSDKATANDSLGVPAKSSEQNEKEESGKLDPKTSTSGDVQAEIEDEINKIIKDRNPKRDFQNPEMLEDLIQELKNQVEGSKEEIISNTNTRKRKFDSDTSSEDTDEHLSDIEDTEDDPNDDQPLDQHLAETLNPTENETTPTENIENIESISIQSDADSDFEAEHLEPVKTEPTEEDENLQNIENSESVENHLTSENSVSQDSEPSRKKLKGENRVNYGALLLRTLNPNPVSFKFVCPVNTCLYKAEKVQESCYESPKSFNKSSQIIFSKNFLLS